MSNAIFHNKWHGFNHFTIPLSGYPDSATDPIASPEFPFRGIFYNTITGNFGISLKEITIFDPGSGFTLTPSVSLRTFPEENVVDQPILNVGVNTSTQTISSIEILDGGVFFSQGILIFTPAPGDTLRRPVVTTLTFSTISAISNSRDWEFYTSLTRNNSGDWGKHFTVRDTTQSLSGFWGLGTSTLTESTSVNKFFTTLNTFSGFYDSVFTQTESLSPEISYDGAGGTGWHIALSSTVHKINEPYQIDNRQKVARPVGLTENKISSTIAWNLSAQTVFYSLTGNNSLTARDIINPKRGGKYVMWVYIDRCPEESAKLTFHPDYYNISVKNLDGSYSQTNNIIALTANYITRIDFVYDGLKMLGKASRYRIYAPTDDDLYFQGSGIRFSDPSSGGNKSPVYINPDKDKIFGIASVDSSIDNISQGGVNIQSYSNTFTETSSFYIPGSGINFRFLNSDNQYFNFTLVNAEFQSRENLNRYQALTGSFDKVIGTLSGGGDWRLPQYAENLIASPNEFSVTDNIILSALPTAKYGGPWVLEESNIKSVKTCLSTYTIEIYSGKNRDIASVIINDSPASINPIIPTTYFGNCYRQPYTFLNERTASYTFERISTDYDIVVTFTPQTPTLIPNLLAWMTAQDDTSLSFTSSTSALTTWRSNTDYDFSISRSLAAIAPVVQTEFGVRRYINFTGNRSMQSAEGTSLRPLTSLSASNSFMKGFTTFTIVKPLVQPLSSVIWWIGDLNTNDNLGGYGLILSGTSNGAQLFTIGNYKQYENRMPLLQFDPTRLMYNRIYVIATKYDPSSNPNRQQIFVNDERSVYQNSFLTTATNPISNFNLIIGKRPQLATGYGRFHLYDFYVYDRALSTSEIKTMNRYLLDRVALFNDSCALGATVNIDELPVGFVPCNTPVQASGGLGYPSPEKRYVLGTGTGVVELEYDAYSVPDRFIVTYNGTTVIDTGYMGSPSYNYGGTQRSRFTSNLLGKEDPVTGMPYPDFSNPSHAPDGYPNMVDRGFGRAYFTKNDITPIDATVQSWAPIPGTGWRAILKCPVPIL